MGLQAICLAHTYFTKKSNFQLPKKAPFKILHESNLCLWVYNTAVILPLHHKPTLSSIYYQMQMWNVFLPDSCCHNFLQKTSRRKFLMNVFKEVPSQQHTEVRETIKRIETDAKRGSAFVNRLVFLFCQILISKNILMNTYSFYNAVHKGLNPRAFFKRDEPFVLIHCVSIGAFDKIPLYCTQTKHQTQHQKGGAVKKNSRIKMRWDENSRQYILKLRNM